MYHDETLIAISFLTFVVAAYFKAKDDVSEELAERAKKVQMEFDAYYKAREKTVEALIAYYKKSSTLLNEISKLAEILKLQITVINSKRRDQVKSNVSAYITKKLKDIVLKEFYILQSLQLKINSLLYKNVQNKLTSSLDSNFEVLLNQSIGLLSEAEKSEFNVSNKDAAVLLTPLFYVR